MNGIKFITAVESYLLRSGIERILNEFTEAEVIASEDSYLNVFDIMRKKKFHFLIISNKILNDFPEKKLPTTNKLILINNLLKSETFFGFATVINVNDTKAEIAQKIGTLIKTITGNSITSESSALSLREQNVVRQVALGKTNKEIAEILFISPHTAMTHRKNITRKLGIKTVSGLTVYAILNKLITIEETQ